MSQTAAPFVHTGPWINWSRGRVLGSTLTLSERDGDLFIAFLGIFVTVAGTASWKIMSFAIHQLRSPPDPQDGIHHQQQAILRNTGSPFQASYELAQLGWSWRKDALRPFVRTLPLVALALFNFALFGVAGIFSSEVAKAAGNETLIRSPDCGFLGFTGDALGSPQGMAAFASMELNDTLAATTYSRACYGSSQAPLQCTQYPQSQLHWKVNQNATCPFQEELCVYGDLSAYEMDTGLIDSHQALGINAPKSERVQYRKVTTCSPIHTKGYITELNDTDPSQPTYGALLQQINYGPTSESNYTYQYNTLSLTESLGYVLSSYVYYGGQNGNHWTPVDALNRTDADVSLFLLAQNNVQYEAPSLDPFYAASTPFNLTGDDGNVTYYVPNQNQRITALACTDQHQYCNPANKQCTILTSSQLTHTALYSNVIGLNGAQMITLRRLDLLTFFLTTYNSVASRGANALRASETVNNLLHDALPANQWMTEVSSWFAVSMAKLQQKVIQYATGPGYVPPGTTLTRPLSSQESKMCTNQIVRSSSATGTTSFSVLGVAIILIVGAVLIPTSLLLPSVLALLRRLFKRKPYKDLQWTVDGKLQLQRMAFEESGQGHWSGGADSVPVTRKGDLLGLPEGVDRKHPRLGRRGSGSGSGIAEGESLMADDDDKGMSVNARAIAA